MKVAQVTTAGYLCRMSSEQPLVPVVMVVHGALGSSCQMAPVVKALLAARRFADVIPVELPGHGETPLEPGAPFTMETFAHAIGSAIARANVPRPLVFGYSMGGYAALLLEQLHPDTVGGIVTLGTMLQWSPDVAARAAARLDPHVLRDKVPAFASVLQARHASAGGWELVLTRTAELLRQLGDHPPLTSSSLAGITCPVHLLVGDRDDSVTLDETMRAASCMPRARASRLPDTPHPIEKVSLSTITREVTDLASRISNGV